MLASFRVRLGTQAASLQSTDSNRIHLAVLPTTAHEVKCKEVTPSLSLGAILLHVLPKELNEFFTTGPLLRI